MKKLSLLLFLALSISCKSDPKGILVPQPTPVEVVGKLSQKAMVVSAREEASRVGLEILQMGGNAFDAMVATEMALAVAYPFAGSLGGGGFMVYRMANGETGTLDFREMAPMEAYRDMYLDKDGNVMPEKSRFGALAVGVPGTVAGIYAAHDKFGSLPMNQILQPVIDLAYRGFIVTQNQANSFNSNRNDFILANNDQILFAKSYSKGDTIKNPALARTLERLVKNGRKEFYGGETGQKMITYLKDKGGIMKIEDLKAYEAKWRAPVSYNYKDIRVISMAPPSSGGIVLGQILKMIEPYSLLDYGHNSLQTIQVLTEAERRAYADRSFYLGDPDFVSVPTTQLLSSEYLNSRMKDFSFSQATPSAGMEHGNFFGKESDETTHYSIVDAQGNAVSVTSTLNGAYGSKLYVEELGFFLNNEMDDFSAKPGEPNMFGLLGAEANSILPGKRMLSSMTPTIVEKNGELFMVLGSPGGSTIITSVLQVILNVNEFNMNMQRAVNAPRFHHQWLPDEIMFEPNGFSREILNSLDEKGYTIREGTSTIIGKVNAILKLPDGTLEGAADPRGDDFAVGF